MTLVLALLGLGVILGTVFQRVTGMGFALLMAPFFAITFGPYEGILLMNLGGAVSSLLVLSRVWRDVDWNRLGLFIAAALPTGAVSALVVSRLPAAPLQVSIGVLLILGLTASLVFRPKQAQTRLAPVAALTAGAVSGVTNAAAGIGGPPIGIYAQATGWAQRNFAATLQPMFFLISISAFVVKTVFAGSAPGLEWWIYPAMVVLILIGLGLGGQAKKFVDEKFARRLVIVFCFAGSLSAIVDGLLVLR